MSIFKDLIADLSSGKRAPMFPEYPEPDEMGLIAVGGELTVATVLEAYAKGCFPWTGEHPIPWFSPDPRLVLFPEHLRTSRSLRKLARQKKFTVRFDCNFRAVMENCAGVSRKGQKNRTWITQNMTDVYGELHDLHIAHSVEVYDKAEQLCGGLYGLTLGHAFFGESMFHKVSDTSKLALYALCSALTALHFDFIDCQQITLHFLRAGAVPLSHSNYMRLLKRTLLYESYHESWKNIADKIREQ